MGATGLRLFIVLHLLIYPPFHIIRRIATTEFIPALGTAIATGVRFTASPVRPKLNQIEAEHHVIKTTVQLASLGRFAERLRETQWP